MEWSFPKFLVDIPVDVVCDDCIGPVIPLEDFERKHVLDSVNTETGLVASNPEQKQQIEDKYDINGQVMVVPKAKAVSEEIVDKYAEVPGAIKRYSEAH